MLYEKHRDAYRSRFDLLVTEIAGSNKPSLSAHEKMGFQTFHAYRDGPEEWQVVAWDWNQPDLVSSIK